MNRLIFYILAAVLLPAPVASFGQDALPEMEPTMFNRIASSEMTSLRLEANLDSLAELRNTEDYIDATLVLWADGEAPERWPVEIRNRGRFRRRACAFPPIKLKFPNDTLEAAGLKRHNELKLVTHCLDTPEGEENLREEYLIYKLYQELSPVHYRSTIVDITYHNTADGREMTRQGIILEDEKELAERYNCTLCEDCYGQADTAFDRRNLQTLTLFQYMVGNSDWSVVMLRNIKLLKPEDGGKFLIAPYDFDFCGLVDASYARTDASLPIETVRDRILLGPLASSGQLEEGIAEFKAREEEILGFVDGFQYLKRPKRRRASRYLKTFFDDLDELPEGGGQD